MNRSNFMNLPALKFLTFYGAGIIAAKFNHLQLITIITISILFIAPFTIICVKKLHPSNLNFLLIISLIALGFLRFTIPAHLIPPNHVKYMVTDNQKVCIHGHVSDYSSLKDSVTTFTLDVEKIQICDSVFIPSCGKILTKCWFKVNNLHISDKVLIKGKIRFPNGQRNPGEFDYRTYLNSKGIFHLLYVYRFHDMKITQARDNHILSYNLIYKIREYIDYTISDHFYDQEKAILKGLILGDRNEIQTELKNAFSGTGVMHVLAVSGLHVGFVVVLITWLLKLLRLPYLYRIGMTIGGITIYMLIIGFKPPVVRASTIVILYMLGKLLQRQTNTLNLLASAALIILIIDPHQLFMASFQLSFSAVLSILFIYTKLGKRLNKAKFFARITRIKSVKYIIELFLVSCAVSIGTAPLTMFYFEKLPIISLLLNIFVVPLVGIIIALGFFYLFVSVFFDFGAFCIAHLISITLKLLICSVQNSALLKAGCINIYNINLTHVLALYILIFLILYIDNLKARKALVFYILIIMNLYSWKHVFTNHNYLEIVYFDVGQGDAAMLITPDKHYALIDGGESKRGYCCGQRFIYPYIRRKGIHELDYVILTHGDNDHVGGLPYILRHVKVNTVIDNGIKAESDIYKDYLHVIDSLGINHTTGEAGDKINLCKNACLFVLHPSPKQEYEGLNNSSIVIKLIYENRSFLFTGDIESEAEESLLRYEKLLKCDILKVAHHGSKSSSIQKFLDYAHPQYAVISVGKYNRFHQPSPEVLERLSESNININRTDLSGAVIFRTDGDSLWHYDWKNQ